MILFFQRSFEKLEPVKVRGNEFSLTHEPHALYSLTTISGQQKGEATPAPDKPFPLPYLAGFEDEAPGATPKYFMDQGGAFEVAARSDGKGTVSGRLLPARPLNGKTSLFLTRV